jgi:hypothetical protein
MSKLKIAYCSKWPVSKVKFLIIAFITFGLCTSCSQDFKSEKQLSTDEKKFIKQLGILDDGEQIILFDSQAGELFNSTETSGNFFTDRRIASYWIDGRDEAKSHVEFAFYHEVDTIWRYPKYGSLTLASYLEVHRKNGTKFKVYVDGDSGKTWYFFNRALETWNEGRVR